MSKISGPLLDRIDMHIEVPAVPFQQLSSRQTGTGSQEIRARVVAARELQAQRFRDRRARANAQMTPRQIREFCPLDDACRGLLETSVKEFGFSARAHDKVLRVARTIADLEGSSTVEAPHLQEAVNYRLLDRSLWK